MRKVLPFMGAALATLAITWATQAKAQQPFADVPQDHWAYQAVTDLQSKGILIGYPDGRFNGQRVLTRYEFAVALKRALDSIKPATTAGPKGDKGDQGDKGEKGEQGEKGEPGPPGMTPEQVQTLMRLTDEFKSELAALGTNVKQIGTRLDELSRQVQAINNRLDKMIQFNGDFFVGFRADRSRNAFIDYSGAARPASNSIVTNIDTPSDFHLEVKANLPGNVKFVGDLVNSNYLTYARSAGGADLGAVNPGTANKNGSGPSQTAVYQAELDIPIGSFGTNTTLTLGRFKNEVTPLTYWRPDADAYFSLPWYDDGNFVQDGFKISSKFGSATTQLWAGSFSNLTTTTAGTVLNAPLVGNGPAGGVLAKEDVGLHIGVPLFKFGEIGVTLADFSTNTGVVGGFGPGGFGNVVLYGANVRLNQIGRFTISGEAAKTVTQKDFGDSDGQENDDNNAYNIHLGYNSGPVGVQAGYQYIDPRYGAPGYWDKIGDTYNPTNVQGPFVRATYNFNKKLIGSVGGDWLSGARNRAGALGATALPTMGSSLGRFEAGVKYQVNNMIHLSADYEGVFFDISGAVTPSGERAKPIEQYITLGAGLNLSGNTVLKLAYQIINYGDRGGLGLNGATPFQNSNANVWTTQVAVHF
ncbi:MAG TPA: S-layer homology domain-containing protein [Chthonomonadaceae bacterium]|nr:S-layer homology domain-containing protein [Chthonomonadaceae bacterium]